MMDEDAEHENRDDAAVDDVDPEPESGPGDEADGEADSAEAPAGSAVDPEPVDGPEVDELAERLRDVDAALELLQSGDLDAAERAIEALEERGTRSKTD